MFNEPTFLELAMKGQVRPEAIDDYIDDWHASLEATCDLHDYLGMTADEYARWWRIRPPSPISLRNVDLMMPSPIAA